MRTAQGEDRGWAPDSGGTGPPRLRGRLCAACSAPAAAVTRGLAEDQADNANALGNA